MWLAVLSPTARNRPQYLQSAQRTGEVAPGNQLGQHRLAGSEPFTSLYWIAQVLIDAPAKGPVIVALGDSITRGDGTTADGDQRYPDHLQRSLNAAGIDGAVVLNAGIGGNRLLRPRVGPSMTDRFDRDVFGVAEASHVVIMGGVNDIALPALLGERRPSAGDIIDGLLRWPTERNGAASSQSWAPSSRSVAAALSPSSLPEMRDMRQAVNHAVRSQKDWPVADFAVRPRRSRRSHPTRPSIRLGRRIAPRRRRGPRPRRCYRLGDIHVDTTT